MRGDQPAIWTTLICALAVGLAGCGPPDARGSPPGDDGALTLRVQDVAGDTARVTGGWSAVEGADLYQVIVDALADTLSTDSTGIAFDVLRRDSTYVLEGCVRGVNDAGAGEAICATAEIPALLTPPAAPDSLRWDVEVDSALLAIFDSARVYDLQRLALQPAAGFDGADSVRAVPMLYEGGEPHVCAEVSGRRGWYPVRLSSSRLPALTDTLDVHGDPTCEYLEPDGTRVGVVVFGGVLATEVRHATDSLSYVARRGWSVPASAGDVTVTALSPATYETATAAVGAEIYVDRGYVLSTLPEGLAGGTLVRTANDDKASTDSAHLTFDVSGQATVWVAYDSRASSLPSWLDGWTADGRAETTDAVFDLYRRTFARGSVTLGGNEGDATGARSMYWIVVTPSDAVLAARISRRTVRTTF